MIACQEAQLVYSAVHVCCLRAAAALLQAMHMQLAPSHHLTLSCCFHLSTEAADHHRLRQHLASGGRVRSRTSLLRGLAAGRWVSWHGGGVEPQATWGHAALSKLVCSYWQIPALSWHIPHARNRS